MNQQTAIVIGSGFGGLGAAIRLQSQGWQVTLLEKRGEPGGRASVIHQDGFTFDAGPTLITMPELLDDLWKQAGRRLSDYVTIKPLDPFYRIWYADGRHIDYTGDPDQMRARIAQFSERDATAYEPFLTHTRRIYAEAFDRLGHQPFLTLGSMVKVLPKLIALAAHRPVYSLAAKYFTHPYMRMLFSFHPLFIGGNPFRASSVYSIVPYLERTGGVHFAMGGMTSLVNGMVRLLQDLGGQIRLNSPVREIIVHDGRATGVLLETGEPLKAEAVISNADATYTYRRLVPASHRKRWTDSKLDGLHQSMSCFLIYLGTNRKYPHLKHHNIIMSDRYRGLLTDIFERKVLADDFSLYLHVPTRTDPSLAPPGGESMYILAPVPHLGDGIDWAQAAHPFRDRILRFLEANLGMDGLEQAIATERLFTPEDFAAQYNAWQGSAFSIEPILTQSAWFRPHNASEEIPGLYLVGAGTHPGAGLPGTLLTAEITARLVSSQTRQPEPIRKGVVDVVH
ncbi:MAG: phytoene desaturase [Bacillota bacterium]